MPKLCRNLVCFVSYVRLRRRRQSCSKEVWLHIYLTGVVVHFEYFLSEMAHCLKHARSLLKLVLAIGYLQEWKVFLEYFRMCRLVEGV